MRRLLDRAVAYISPERALRRAQARQLLAYYEAAKPSTQRAQRRERGGPDTAIIRAGKTLREQARHLEQNHDLARGVLSVLVQNVVGANGIGFEPQPRRADGSIHEDLARQILNLHRDWAKRPEVTWQHSWASVQRLLARCWFRDGEGLAQHLMGPVRGLQHGTRVPYSLELVEADYLPLDYHHPAQGIIAGVERNAWGRPTRYWLYKQHPTDFLAIPRGTDLKGVAADRISHVKIVERVRQVRGASVFASVLTRLDDIKDYEESERIAAKVAASMAAFIKKGGSEDYIPPQEEPGRRDLRFRPGMIFDDLRVGEDVGTIDTNRPNTGLEHHRRGQLRAVAAGTGVTYSSVSKDYDGTYSAQRQELVEGWGAYAVLANEFIGQFVQPATERMIRAAVASGQLRIPSDVDPESVVEGLYIPPVMPWIDPDKEARSLERLERNVHASGPEIIRRRGQNPRDVMEQEANWRDQLRQHGLRSDADPASEDDNPEDNDAQPDPGARARAVRRRA